MPSNHTGNTTHNTIPEVKSQQLQYECNSWDRLLTYLSEENIQRKNRLSQLLKQEFEGDMLKDIEIFQSLFLRQDEFIAILRHDLAMLEEFFRKGKDSVDQHEEITNYVKRLRNNTMHAERYDAKIKTDFNDYLQKITSVI